MQDLTKELMTFLKSKGYKQPPYVYGSKFTGKVPYSGPYYDDNEIEAAIDAILFGKWSVAGENVAKFENEYAKVVKHKHALMINSGSSANLVMIAALKKVAGWKWGDEVIVSAVGFPTTVSALVQNGLKPVFVDIEMDTLNFSLEKVFDAITVNTKAIFLSPVLGNPPDMKELHILAKMFRGPIILDGCDSLGTEYDGHELTELAVSASCSFYMAHHMATMSGGAVSSDNEEVIAEARSFASWGMSCYCKGACKLTMNGACGQRFSNWLTEMPEVMVDHRYVYNNMGYNLLPLDLVGAIGLQQLKKLPEIHEKRRINKYKIDQIFKVVSGLKAVQSLSLAKPSWFGVPFVCDSQELKDRFVIHLESKGIQTRHYFAGNLLLHDGYKMLGDWKLFPNANEVLKKVFFVGCAPFLTEEHFDHIKKAVESFV